jgi:hypothetical protein
MMNSEYHIFTIGKRYRVKRDFQDGICKFAKGEILTSTAWGFIPYDDAYGYDFHSETDPNSLNDKAWRLFANKSPETWRDFFEPVD